MWLAFSDSICAGDCGYIAITAVVNVAVAVSLQDLRQRFGLLLSNSGK